MPGVEQTDRRERILDVAGHHFATQPYERVSTVAIAQAADVNRGWLYHEFGSKRDLYLAVLRRTVKIPSLPPLSGLNVDPGRLDEEIADLIARWLDDVEAHRSAYLLMFQVHAGSRSDPVVRGILRELHAETIDNAIRVYLQDATGAPPAARAMVAAFGELSWQVLWEWLDSGRLDRDQAQLILSRSIATLAEIMPEVLE